MDIQLSSLSCPRSCPLREWTLINPEAVALVFDGEQRTRLWLDNKVDQVRSGLSLQGVAAGDKVVVPVTSAYEALLMLIASLREGWVFCPVNISMPDGQLKLYCDRVSAQWILGKNLNALPRVDLPEFIEKEIPVETSVYVNPELPCDLIATSGTTGTPKAVSHSYSNHWHSAEGARKAVPLVEGDRWLLSLPLFHVGGYGIVIRCLLMGATMVIDSHKTPLGTLLKSSAITHLSLVNTQLRRLLRVDNCNLGETSLKIILLGGGVVSPELVKAVSSVGIQILTTYGMTEMSSQVCTGTPVFIGSAVTSGQVLPYREVSVSESGEILVRGKTLSQGYYSDGKLTSLVDSNGWYHTGDLGDWQGEDIKVTGRIDNMFISGGENIHPEEIEKALLAINDIVQAVVVSVPDAEFGSRPWAYVETASGELNELFTKQQLKGSISRFKFPDVIRLFPKSMRYSGLKPNRHSLQMLAQRECASANVKPD